jgi:hypothetical protein
MAMAGLRVLSVSVCFLSQGWRQAAIQGFSVKAGRESRNPGEKTKFAGTGAALGIARRAARRNRHSDFVVQLESSGFAASARNRASRP